MSYFYYEALLCGTLFDKNNNAVFFIKKCCEALYYFFNKYNMIVFILINCYIFKMQK